MTTAQEATPDPTAPATPTAEVTPAPAPPDTAPPDATSPIIDTATQNVLDVALRVVVVLGGLALVGFAMNALRGSVPQETVTEFNKQMITFARETMSELKQNAESTRSPYDDIAVDLTNIAVEELIKELQSRVEVDNASVELALLGRGYGDNQQEETAPTGVTSSDVEPAGQ